MAGLKLGMLYKSFRYEVSNRVSANPRLFLPLFRLAWRGDIKDKRKLHVLSPKLVSPNTDIVIEGFPRSANTFATASFILAQQKPVNVAHHTHAAAQVLLATEWGIPVILLIREPMDAVISLVIRESHLSPEQGFASYIRFYKTVEKAAKHTVLAPFELVVKDFASVVRAVNLKYKTEFGVPVASQAFIRKVFALIEEREAQVGTLVKGAAIPKYERGEQKEIWKRRIESENRLRTLVREAELIYQKLVALEGA